MRGGGGEEGGGEEAVLAWPVLPSRPPSLPSASLASPSPSPPLGPAFQAVTFSLVSPPWRLLGPRWPQPFEALLASLPCPAPDSSHASELSPDPLPLGRLSCPSHRPLPHRTALRAD